MEEARPSFWTRAGAWLEERSEGLNAILVRELRRALNGRIFVGAFFVLLFLCLMASLVATAGAEDRDNMGWTVFAFLFMALCGVSFLSLPMMIAGMISSEIKERTFELLSITTLTGRRIVWGELLTAMGLFVLYASAVAPFMAFSYLLGGVDFRTIASGLGVAFLGSLFLSLLSVLGASQRAAEASIRVLVAIVALAFLGFCGSLISTWERPLETMWDEPDFPQILLVVGTAYVTLGAVIFTAASGQLTFASANRAGPVRLAVAAHVAAVAIAGAVYASTEPELCAVLCVYAMAILFFLGCAVLGEGETLTRRQLRAGRIGARLPYFWSLFLPGARRGLAFLFLLGAAVAILGTLAGRVPLRYNREILRHIPFVCWSYLVLFLSIGHWLGCLVPARLRRPMVLRGVGVGFFMLMLLVPFIVSIIFGFRYENDPGLTVLHPIYFLPVMFDHWRDVVPAILMLYAATGLVGLLTVGSLVRSMRAAVGAREVRKSAAPRGGTEGESSP